VDPPSAEEAEKQHAPFDVAAAATLPTTLDHEREFVRIAELALAWAQIENDDAVNWVPPSGVKVVGGPSRGTAAKLLDCAIKARRAAHAAAREREDWVNTDRLERAAAELNQRRTSRPGATAPTTPPAVRH
jgi:hypothetical protein